MRRDTLAEIEAVYRQRFPVFLRVAVAIVGDEQLARDAVQDGFVRAVRYRRRLRGEPEAWIWRIVVNEARRRRVQEGRLVLVDPAALPEPSTNGHAEPGDVHSLVAALPDRQRLVLFLRYYADLDYEAIAAALEVAPGTVAATLNAAHSKLRTQMRATSVGF